MNILCISDTVLPELNAQVTSALLEPVDLVISCGDLPPEYLNGLQHTFKAPLFYVRGNHDIRYSQTLPQAALNIHGRLVRFGPLKILGLEGSRWYNGGPIQYTETQMSRFIRRLRMWIWMRGGLDVIVTHAPPRHIHDAEDPCHRGFRAFHTLIQRYTPYYFLHGHIHAQFENDAQRMTRVGRTWVVNCYGCCRLEIDEKQVASKN